jgi:hypothetical protein
MDFSVEHGYRYLRILAGNEEPVCQFKLPHQGVHHTAAKAGASCAKTVPESDVFMPLGLAWSEKQIPQIIENVGNKKRGRSDEKGLWCFASIGLE